MSDILGNLKKTVISGLVLTLVVFIIVRILLGSGFALDHQWFAFLFRWLHVISGVMWVGLLFYLNFVQIPNMANIPDEQKPAIGKVIMPSVLWWFRWAAMATIATGLIVAGMNGYLIDAILLGYSDGGASTPIGIGMWLGAIMWFNVWFVIWPLQKKILGLIDATAEEKADAARLALLVSRANLALVFPMLFSMVAMQNGGFA